MVDRVFIHIGLPKTATTYLQSIFWSAKDDLRAGGVALPGNGHGDHRWASRIVRDYEGLDKRPQAQRSAWKRVRNELRRNSGTGLISHELLASASVEQAQRMVAELPTDDVHVVVTAREPLGLFTASWQETVKIGSTTPLSEYSPTASEDPSDTWNWRTLDLGLVLQRWAQAVPPERIHVLVLDPKAPRDDVWHRFAGIIGFDSSAVEVEAPMENSSLGVAEVETLRRVNQDLQGPWSGLDRGSILRRYLAEQRLVPRKGERFWPEPEQVEDARRRGEDTVAHLKSAAYDISGDLENLRVPLDLPDRRLTSSVTDSEVAQVATALAAEMLADIRALRRGKDPTRGNADRGKGSKRGRGKPRGKPGRAKRQAAAAPEVSAPRRAARRVLDRLPDERRRQVVRVARRLRGS